MIEYNKVKVGVLIPTLNRKEYLAKALESVCGQTYDHIEILVIDNNSNDGTAQFMTSWNDPRVRYIVNETDIGMIGSINKGINLFSDKAEWCTILSDDDLLDKDFIMELVRTVEKYAAKSIVHSHRIFIDQQGNKIREAKSSPEVESAFDYLAMRSHFKRETYLSGVMFNRKVFQEIKGYPDFSTGLASDDAFIFALALRDRLIFERAARAYIRIHEKAESRSFTGTAQKIQTIKEFSDYCKHAVLEHAAPSPVQMQFFYKMLRRYVIILCSGYWLRDFHYLLDRKHNGINKELTTLTSLVINNNDLFSPRVRFSTSFERATGLCLESFKTYRFFLGIAEGCVYRASWLS